MEIDVRVRIPKKLKLSKAQARTIVKEMSQRAVTLIRTRLSKGRGADGRPMPAYSDEYRKALKESGQSVKRDTKLTGSLHRNLRVLRFGLIDATVGWSGSRAPKTSLKKGGVMQPLRLGQTHREVVQRLAKQDRPVLGITKADRSRLLKVVRKHKKKLIKKG